METAEKLNVSINKSSFKNDLVLLKISSVRSIVDIEGETGSFLSNTVNRGRRRTIRAAAIEEQVIIRITENSRLSTIQIALEVQNVSFSTVWKILNETLLHPYHIQ